MKLHALILLGMLQICLSSCTRSSVKDLPPTSQLDKSALVLNLRLDGTMYEAKQPVRAVLSLTNRGKSDFVVNARMAINSLADPAVVRDVVFTVISPSGQKVGFAAKVDYSLLDPGAFVLLRPGSSIQKNCDLEQYFLLDEIGIYSASAVYDNQFDPSDGRSAWKGHLESNTVQFEIR